MRICTDKMKRSELRPWLYSLPALVLVGVVVVFPIGYTGYMSVTNMNLYHWQDYSFIGFLNYQRALLKVNSGFLTALLTTILWTAVNMVIDVCVSYVLAVLLNTEGLRAKRLYKTLLIFPWAMPSYVSILVWRIGMYNTEFGYINKLLYAAGFRKINFLSRNVPAFIACTVVSLWMSFPYMITMFDGALQSIDRSMIESARLDGAGTWALHRHIIIPAVRPVMTPAIIMSAFVTFKQFDIVYLLLHQRGSISGATMHTIVSYAYENAFVSNNYGLSSAVSIVIFIIIIVLSLVTGRMQMEE